jgi:hypothetical protein
MSGSTGPTATGGILITNTSSPGGDGRSVAARGGSTLQGEAEREPDAFVQGEYNRLGYSLYPSACPRIPYREAKTAHTKIKTRTLCLAATHPNAKSANTRTATRGRHYREEAETTTLGEPPAVTFRTGLRDNPGRGFQLFDENAMATIASYFPTGISISGKRVPAFDTPEAFARRELAAPTSRGSQSDSPMISKSISLL